MIKTSAIPLLIIVLLSSSSAFGMETGSRKKTKNLKKTISDVKTDTTLFGRWLNKYEQKLRKNKAFNPPQDKKAGDISVAGIVFLMFNMPKPIQKTIAKYLIHNIRPSILGLHKEDLSSHKIFNEQHADVPFLIRTKKSTYEIKCNLSPHCTIPIELVNMPTNGFTTNAQSPHQIGSIIDLINPNKDIPFSGICAFIPNTQEIFTDQDKHIIRWSVIKKTINHEIFTNENSPKNKLGLYAALLLLDQEHVYTPSKKITTVLSYRTKKHLDQLQQHIKHQTGAEPFFVSAQLYQ